MQNRIRMLIAGLAALALLYWAPFVAAEEDESPSVTVPVVRQNPLGVKPLDRSVLASRRGGMDVVNDMRLRGVVADNEAINVVTGMNIINDGALAGASGLPMVIQNSGNNVLIQNATIVNVQVK